MCSFYSLDWDVLFNTVFQQLHDPSETSDRGLQFGVE